MRISISRHVKTLAVLAIVALTASDASAVYHTRLGRFLQRDPGPSGTMGPTGGRLGTAGPATGGSFMAADPRPGQGYQDGMNQYQYVRGNPMRGADPMGTRVIFLSGLLQFPGASMAKGMAQSVGQRLSQSNLVQRGRTQGINYAVAGGGGDIPEISLRKKYQDFVRDKEQSPCSVEQFVVVGFSDGATALYHLLMDGTFRTDYPPAYIGLMDLVRLNYVTNMQINDKPDGIANIASVRPQFSRIENWYQTTGNFSANLAHLGGGIGLMGRNVVGADRNTNINVWHFGREDMPGQRSAWEASANLGHGSLYADPQVRSEVMEAVGLWYVQKAKEEARRMRKTIPWVMKEGEHW